MGRNGCSGTQQLFSEHPHFLSRLGQFDVTADYPGSKLFGTVSEFLRQTAFHSRLPNFSFLLSTFAARRYFLLSTFASRRFTICKRLLRTNRNCFPFAPPKYSSTAFLHPDQAS